MIAAMRWTSAVLVVMPFPNRRKGGDHRFNRALRLAVVIHRRAGTTAGASDAKLPTIGRKNGSICSTKMTQVFPGYPLGEFQRAMLERGLSPSGLARPSNASI